MITKLTKEQEARMNEIQEEWLGRVFSCATKIDEAALTEGIGWLYKELLDLDPPQVEIYDTPLQAQERAWELTGKKGYITLSRAGVYDYFLAYYVFFRELGVVQLAAFDKYEKLLRSGMYSGIDLDTHWLAIRMPDRILRNEEHQLHSLEYPAVSWPSDKGKLSLYFIEGIGFDKEVWEKISEGTMVFKDIIALENMEQRMMAMKYVGMDELLAETNHELIEKTERGNELFLVRDIFEDPMYFLRYSCPSTGRVYVSAVPEEEGNKGADASMAWKHHMTLAEYRSMSTES